MASCAACGRAAVSNRVVVRPKSLGVGPGALCFARVGTPRRGAEFYRLPVRLLLAGRRAEVGPGGDGGGEEGEAKRPLRRDGAGGWAGGRRGGRRRREASAFPPPGASAGHAPRATRALWAGGLAAGPAARLSREGGGRRAAAPCGRTSARRRPRRTASSARVAARVGPRARQRRVEGCVVDGAAPRPRPRRPRRAHRPRAGVVACPPPTPGRPAWRGADLVHAFDGIVVVIGSEGVVVADARPRSRRVEQRGEHERAHGFGAVARARRSCLMRRVRAARVTGRRRERPGPTAGSPGTLKTCFGCLLYAPNQTPRSAPPPLAAAGSPPAAPPQTQSDAAARLHRRPRRRRRASAAAGGCGRGRR